LRRAQNRPTGPPSCRNLPNPHTPPPRAGARDTIYHDPKHVTAAIVTCGGLCPGLNDVVAGLVNKLTDYGVPEGNILGIRYGFRCAAWDPAAVRSSCRGRWQGVGRCKPDHASTAL
jgi:hypothetical protein